jgi:hypothetical protein
MTNLFATGDDQRFEVVDRLGPCSDRATTGDQEHPERFAVAATTGLSEMLAGERFAGGTDSVELIGLGAVATGGPGRPVDLNDPFASLQQERGEPGSVAAAGFDRPDSTAGRVQLREPQDPLVAERVAWDRLRVGDRAGGSDDDRGGVRVAVGVDTDDVVDLVCEDGHA